MKKIILTLLMAFVPLMVHATTYEVTTPGNNVGIGTPTPGQALDVNGTVRAQAFTTNGNGSSYLQLTANASDTSIPPTGTGNLYETTASKQLFFQDETGLITNLMTGGLWTISSPQVYLTTSTNNVGIGTNTPLNKLDVKGSIAIGTYGGAKLSTASNSLIVSGNVGIGTWIIPSNRMALNDTFTDTTKGKGQLILQNTNDGVSGIVFNNPDSGTNHQAAIYDSWFGDDGSGTFNTVGMTFAGGNNGGGGDWFQWENNSGTRLMSLGSGQSTNSNLSINGPRNTTDRLGVGGNIGIGTNASSYYINTATPAAGSLIVEGNIGIGTFTPTQKIDVRGAISFTTNLTNTTSSTGIGWSEHNATNQACNTTCGSSACVIGLDIGTVGVVNSGFVACTDATADDCICAGP